MYVCVCMYAWYCTRIIILIGMYVCMYVMCINDGEKKIQQILNKSSLLSFPYTPKYNNKLENFKIYSANKDIRRHINTFIGTYNQPSHRPYPLIHYLLHKLKISIPRHICIWYIIRIYDEYVC